MTEPAGYGSVFSLDDDTALDPQRAGAKAAWLAKGRRAGLPVLDGVVVDATESVRYLELGATTLETGSSGAARLAVSSAEPPECVHELELRAAHLSSPLVVRSSSLLESGGEWAGAFTSYLDLRHGELGIGLLGCWASVFSAATLQRFEAAAIEPVSAPMAVLVQPALDTDFGGTARLVAEEVEVIATKGSPAPLVQGWEPGVAARVSADGAVSGGAAVDLLGEDLLRRVATVIRTAADSIGATMCEWGAAAGRLTVFQLAKPPPPPAITNVHDAPVYRSEVAWRIARLVRRFPGPIGERLVLPWAIGMDTPPEPEEIFRVAGMGGDLRQMAETLVAGVWGGPKAAAVPRALRTLRMVRSDELETALSHIAGLQPPDTRLAACVLGVIAEAAERAVAAGVVSEPEDVWWLEPEELEAVLRNEPVAPKQRFGYDRWEPFTAAVVAASGTSAAGSPAAAGLGAGRVCRILGTDDMERFRPRDVVVSTHPVPNLAPLLWDAAAVVTSGGSPAAHLFESARALGIPAVAGVRLEDLGEGDGLAGERELVMAVDGAAGVVAVQPW